MKFFFIVIDFLSIGNRTIYVSILTLVRNKVS